MSKIAEKIHDTALKKGEKYSESHGGSIIEEVAYGRGYKSGYIEGYDQAMQDFLEKACEWLEKELLVSDIEHQKYWLMTEENKSNFIEGFKNYMQNEM